MIVNSVGSTGAYSAPPLLPVCIVARCDSRIFAARMPFLSLLQSSLLPRHNGARQSDAGRAFCVKHARAALCVCILSPSYVETARARTV